MGVCHRPRSRTLESEWQNLGGGLVPKRRCVVFHSLHVSGERLERVGRIYIHVLPIRTARNSFMSLSRLCCRPRSMLPRESNLTKLRRAPDLSHLPPPPAPSSGRSQMGLQLPISCAPFSYPRDRDTSRKSRSIGKAIILPLSVRGGKQVWFLNATDSHLQHRARDRHLYGFTKQAGDIRKHHSRM